MATPSPRSDGDLRAWTSGIIEREQNLGTYGKVIVHLEEGRIIRVTIEKSELPPKPSG